MIFHTAPHISARNPNHCVFIVEHTHSKPQPLPNTTPHTIDIPQINKRGHNVTRHHPPSLCATLTHADCSIESWIYNGGLMRTDLVCAFIRPVRHRSFRFRCVLKRTFGHRTLRANVVNSNPRFNNSIRIWRGISRRFSAQRISQMPRERVWDFWFGCGKKLAKEIISTWIWGEQIK